MRISIIIPSFNQGTFIERTLKSVLDQDYADFEVIVVDGKSTDKTHSILERYKTNPHINWIRDIDKNQTNAINIGLKYARGEIVSYLNSDDLLAPECISYISAIFSDKEVKWVTGDTQIINTDNKEIFKLIRLYKSFFRHFASAKLLGVIPFISQPSTFWRRELIAEVGYFNEELNYTMDYDYWSRLYQLYNPYITHKVLSLFRVHTSSKSNRDFMAEFNEGYFVCKKYCPAYIVFLHKLHIMLITTIYRFIKK